MIYSSLALILYSNKLNAEFASARYIICAACPEGIETKVIGWIKLPRGWGGRGAEINVT